MLDALADVFAERRKMMDALIEMGHADVIEEEPRGLMDHLAMVKRGHNASIGSPEDPFRILSAADRRLIASYYIDAWVDDRSVQCEVRFSGSAAFMDAMEVIAERWQARWRSELH